MASGTAPGPPAATIAAFGGGLVAGTVTALLNTKGGINPLLAGILTQLALYSMTLFPGTEITGRALAEGRVEKADIDPEKSLVRLERNSYRVLLWLLGRGLPKAFTGLLTYPLVFRFLRSGIFNPLWGLLGALLDRKEGKQLLSWTWAHRVRVMKRFYPSFPTEDLSVPHLGGRRR